MINKFKSSNHKKIYSLIATLDQTNIELAKMLALSSNIDIYAEIYLPYFKPLFTCFRILKNNWIECLQLLESKIHFNIDDRCNILHKCLNGEYNIQMKNCSILNILLSEQTELNLVINSKIFPKLDVYRHPALKLKSVYIKDSKISQYKFGSNQITNFDGDQKSLNYIRRLSLSANNLVEIPTCIWNMPNLTHLFISNNNISELNLKNVNLESSKLKQINIDHNDLSKCDIMKLKNKLPKCSIYSDYGFITT